MASDPQEHLRASKELLDTTIVRIFKKAEVGHTFDIDIGPTCNVFTTEDWIVFRRSDSAQGSGWKLHISVRTPLAQEHLAKLALRFDIVHFKFAIDIKKYQRDNYSQSGKVAVFYHTLAGTHNRPIDWAAFINEAERVNQKYGGAGKSVQRDRQITGSVGIYYRNDRDRNGNYIARDGITKIASKIAVSEDSIFNMAGVADPFKEIELRDGKVFVGGDEYRYATSQVNDIELYATIKPFQKSITRHALTIQGLALTAAASFLFSEWRSYVYDRRIEQQEAFDRRQHQLGMLSLREGKTVTFGIVSDTPYETRYRIPAPLTKLDLQEMIDPKIFARACYQNFDGSITANSDPNTIIGYFEIHDILSNTQTLVIVTPQNLDQNARLLCKIISNGKLLSTNLSNLSSISSLNNGLK